MLLALLYKHGNLEKACTEQEALSHSAVLLPHYDLNKDISCDVLTFEIGKVSSHVMIVAVRQRRADQMHFCHTLSCHIVSLPVQFKVI